MEDFFTPEELQPCRDSISQMVDNLADKLHQAGKITGDNSPRQESSTPSNLSHVLGQKWDIVYPAKKSLIFILLAICSTSYLFQSIDCKTCTKCNFRQNMQFMFLDYTFIQQLMKVVLISFLSCISVL